MLQNKTVTKILSVAIAILLWLYVVGEVNPTTEQTFEGMEVKLLNENSLEEEGLAVFSEEGFVVDVHLEGKRADLKKVDRSDVVVTADLKGYEKGDNYVPVNVTVPDDIKIDEVNPAKLLVSIEELVTEKKTVQVIFNGDAGQGKEPGGVTVDPEEIEVKGAKSAVKDVKGVNATVEVSKIDRNDTEITTEAVAVNSLGEEVQNIRLSEDTVKVTASIYHTRKVPLKVKVEGEPPEGYELKKAKFPDTIRIRGKADDIAKVKDISTNSIDVSHISETTQISLDPQLPEGIELASESQKLRAEVIIKKMETATVTIPRKDVEIKGLRAEAEAKIDTELITISASGSETLIKKISKSDFIVSISLSGLREGTHEVEASVEYDKKFSNVSIKPTKIRVTIEE